MTTEPQCQNVRPDDSDDRRKRDQVRDMFDNIAPAYDTMNRLMTLGIDRRWRRALVNYVRRARPRDILDIATGTGDLAILLAKANPEAKVTGIDLSEEMVKVGQHKVLSERLAEQVNLHVGDSLNLPFTEESFDAVTVSFGVRNFEDLLRGYNEMWRVLRSGGVLCVLELSTPTGALVKPFYNIYTNSLIPLLGKMIAGDRGAYTYLPRSIAAVPQGNQMLDIISAAGFSRSAFRTFTLGVATLYIARK